MDGLKNLFLGEILKNKPSNKNKSNKICNDDDNIKIFEKCFIES